jgi:hypothetical membrane protein
MQSTNSLERTKNGLIRFAGICGIVGSVLPLVLVLSATYLSAGFSWSTDALSDLGIGNQSIIFNGAVLLGGILNVAFAFGLKKFFAKRRLLSGGVASIIAGSVCLGLVGVFTTDFSLVHTMVALGYFLLVPLGFLLIGFGANDYSVKLLSISGGVGALVSILALPLLIFGLQLNVGFAVPELAESLVISVWTILMSTKLLKKQIYNTV